MAVNVPVPELLDVQKIELGLMPRKADGHVDITTPMLWSVDVAPDVGVIAPGTDPFIFQDPQHPEDGDITVPGDRRAFALTPGTTGTFNVTAHADTAAGAQPYEDAIFGPIVYKPGQPLSLNPSVGSPVSDL